MTRGAALAFDLGGTRLKAGVVSLDDDRVLEEGATADTPADGDDALRAVREIGEGLRARHPCVGVGLAVPGLVDDDGVLVVLPGKLPGLAVSTRPSPSRRESRSVSMSIATKEEEAMDRKEQAEKFRRQILERGGVGPRERKPGQAHFTISRSTKGSGALLELHAAGD